MSNKSTTDVEDVRQYLLEHKEFFVQNSDLLQTLSLPHSSGDAVSLVERQMGVLREKNEEMRQRIEKMLGTARKNDRLFDKTNRLVLTLLEAETLSALVEKLYDSLGMDFRLEYYSLILLQPPKSRPKSMARLLPAKEAPGQIATLLENGQSICGPLRDNEMSYLFGDDGKRIGSAAAIRLKGKKQFGILAVGSSDPNYYRSDMGTLFLDYIAEVLNRTVPALLKS